MLPACVTVATMLSVAFSAALSVPRSQLTTLPFVLQVPCEAAAETKIVLAGRRLVRVTAVAGFGPVLVTVIR